MALRSGCLSHSAGFLGLLGLWAASVTALTQPASASVLHVDSRSTASAPDGTTWATAYPSLTSAIERAAAGDQLWLAEGTYRESVVLQKGIGLFGGFAGTETSRLQRDLAAHHTLLSASGAVVSISSGAATVTLDGLTITGGSAPLGAGVLVDHARAIISHCTITGNTASSSGGGLYASSSVLDLTYSVIRGNTAVVGGGGLCLSDCTGRVAFNTVEDNACDTSDGRNGLGGAFSITGGSPRVMGNIVRRNRGTLGGAFYLDGTACRIEGCVMRQNEAPFGAGVFTTLGAPVLVNNTIVRNPVGAAVMVEPNLPGQPMLANNIIAFNDVGLFDLFGAAVTRRNDVFGNHSNYEHEAGVAVGANDISADPLLVDDISGLAHLLPASPCRDAGANLYLMLDSVDIDGTLRPIDGTVDIGADEFDGTVHTRNGAYRVRPDGDDANDGTSWTTAKRTVQAALDVAWNSGMPVWVAAGTYVERIDLHSDIGLYGGFDGTESDFPERDPRTNESILDGGNAGTVVTMGQGASSVLDGFTIRNGSGTRLWSNSEAVCGGGILIRAGTPTITNNVITGNRLPGSSYGGGIYGDYGSPVIEGNTFTGNEAGSGAAIAFWYNANYPGSPVVRDNVFTGNHASGAGGAIWSLHVQALITGNTFTENTSAGWAGGVDCSEAPVTITRNTFTRNRAAERGGGIVMTDGVASGNVLTANSAKIGGGFYVFGYQKAYRVVNNTMVANDADEGGAMYLNAAWPEAVIANNVIAWNSSGIYKESVQDIAVRSNCTWRNGIYDFQRLDAAGKDGNISADPRLAAVLTDAHIQPDSPCRDAGDDAAILVGTADMDGQDRIQGLHVDIGADESDGTAWDIPIPVVRVRPGGSDGNDGLTWETAKATVQAAVDSVAGTAGEVWVAGGVYTGTITLPPFVFLYGGFAGTESSRNERDWRSQETTLDGGWAGSVVTFLGRYQVGGLDGFTVRNGTGTLEEGGAGARLGGGVYCAAAAPTIANCHLTANVASVGGALYLRGPAFVENNLIAGNTALGGGGAIALQSAGAVLVNNRIVGNASSTGAAIALGGSWQGASPSILHNTIVGNRGDAAGTVVTMDAACAFRNNIVAFNTAGIRSSVSAVDIRNNCFYGNTGPDLVSSVAKAVDSITADPKIAGALTGDLHIQPSSPCADAGDASPLPVASDMDGQPRIQGARPDVGADESDGSLWPGPPTVRVAPSGDDANPGDAWAAAKRTVGAAIEALGVTGGEVWVASGTYSERVTLRPFVHVYGGFAGMEDEREQARPASNPTVLDGGGSSSVVTAPPGAMPSTLDGFVVRGGQAERGGGVALRLASPAITRNRIEGNAAGEGAGIYADTSLSLIAGNVIVGNTATGLGGGVFTGPFSAAMVNNTIVKNAAADGGGLASRVTYGNFTLVNNIIAFNSSGLWNGPNGGAFRSNCVFGNTAYDYHDYDGTGTDGNVRFDPDVVDPAGGDYHLRPTSLCIDRGDPRTVPGGQDMDGDPRLAFGRLDIGADESSAAFVPPPPRIIRVSPTGSDANDGSTWAMAKATIRAAAEEAVNPGSEVWVAAGTYRESVLLWTGADLFGGFAGTETERGQRDPRRHETVLDFQEVASGPGIRINESGADAAVVDGFTLKNARYGAILCVGAAPALRNNVFTANSAPYGAGVLSVDGAPVISGNTFTGNEGRDGSAILLRGVTSTPARITGNTFQANRVTQTRTEAVVTIAAPAEVVGNTFLENTQYALGCVSAVETLVDRNTFLRGDYGIVVNGVTVISNNLIAGHRSHGISASSGTVKVVGNTIAGNGATRATRIGDYPGTYYLGAGVYFANASVTLDNNILFGNGYGVSWQPPYQDGASASIALSGNCVFGNPGGNAYGIANPIGTNGNIAVDPLLGPDYRLAATSPCVEAGLDGKAIGALDRDGLPRIAGAHVDMGAFERQNADLTLADALLALRLAGGLTQVVDPTQVARLNVVDAELTGVDIVDAVEVARRLPR